MALSQWRVGKLNPYHDVSIEYRSNTNYSNPTKELG